MTILLAALCLFSPQNRLPENIRDKDFKLAIKVTLDDQPIKFPDTQPMMVASTILVPMRGVFEQMGATLTWDKPSRTVTAERGAHHVKLVMGSNTGEVDGAPVALMQPAIVVQGRTMVPLRFLSQALGVKVDWLAAERTVAITTVNSKYGPSSNVVSAQWANLIRWTITICGSTSLQVLRTWS